MWVSYGSLYKTNNSAHRWNPHLLLKEVDSAHGVANEAVLIQLYTNRCIKCSKFRCFTSQAIVM